MEDEGESTNREHLLFKSLMNIERKDNLKAWNQNVDKYLKEEPPKKVAIAIAKAKDEC